MEVLMSGIMIVTDSDASLPAKVADELDIIIVPINVQFGEETLQSEVEITDAQLFERVDRTGTLPTTSAPSPGQFAQAYQQAFDKGADEVICICVSSNISGTYNSAVNACDLLPDKRVTVVDSESVSMGQGYMVLAAARAAHNGLDAQKVIETAKNYRDRATLYASLATLKYLAMSGRVGYLAAGMASILNIKPILTIQEGKLEMLEKVRTKKKAWGRLIELTKSSLNGKKAVEVAIVHVNAKEDATAFEAVLREKIDCPEEILVADFTAGLSVHTGRGMIGVAAVAEN
jgi:DegV family protein with EDD domain